MTSTPKRHDKNWHSNVIHAIIIRDTETLNTILKDPGLDVNFSNGSGYSLLMIAARSVNIHAFDLLLAHPDINLNHPDAYGETALMHISQYEGNSRTEACYMAQSLINAGADLDIVDNFKQSALMYATDVDRTDILEILINAGADLEIEDGCEDRALSYAAFYKNIAAIKLLLTAGADIDGPQRKNYLEKFDIDPKLLEINKEVRQQKQIEAKERQRQKEEKNKQHLTDIANTTARLNRGSHKPVRRRPNPKPRGF